MRNAKGQPGKAGCAFDVCGLKALVHHASNRGKAEFYSAAEIYAAF